MADTKEDELQEIKSQLETTQQQNQTLIAELIAVVKQLHVHRAALGIIQAEHIMPQITQHVQAVQNNIGSAPHQNEED